MLTPEEVADDVSEKLIGRSWVNIFVIGSVIYLNYENGQSFILSIAEIEKDCQCQKMLR